MGLWLFMEQITNVHIITSFCCRRGILPPRRGKRRACGQCRLVRGTPSSPTSCGGNRSGVNPTTSRAGTVTVCSYHGRAAACLLIMSSCGTRKGAVGGDCVRVSRPCPAVARRQSRRFALRARPCVALSNRGYSRNKVPLPNPLRGCWRCGRRLSGVGCRPASWFWGCSSCCVSSVSFLVRGLGSVLGACVVPVSCCLARFWSSVARSALAARRLAVPSSSLLSSVGWRSSVCCPCRCSSVGCSAGCSSCGSLVLGSVLRVPVRAVGAVFRLVRFRWFVLGASSGRFVLPWFVAAWVSSCSSGCGRRPHPKNRTEKKKKPRNK